MTCFALFQATSQPIFVSRRGPGFTAFHRPLCRQIQPRHQRGSRIESLELHALFRPDGESKKRTPLLRTSTNMNKKGTGSGGGNRGIKITSGGGHKHKPIPSTASSSVDKMRLDLMRSDLSVKISEDRVKRLESELKEMTKKYNWAQSALRDRASTGGARKHSTPLKGKHQSSQVQRQQKQKKHQPPSHVKAKTKPLKGKNLVQNGLHTTILPKGGGNKKKSSANGVRSTASTNSSFQGNTIDDLPPFAAGLFAHAEREEKKRRLKLGLIEEADLEDLSSSSSVAPNALISSTLPTPPSSSSPSSIETLPPMAAGLFEQAERIEMKRRAKMGFIEKSEVSLSSLHEDVDDIDFVDDDYYHHGTAVKDIPVVVNITRNNATMNDIVDHDEEVRVSLNAFNISITDSNVTTAVEKKFKSLSIGNTTEDKSIKSIEAKETKKPIDVNPAAQEVISANDVVEKELLSLRKQCAILSHKLSRSEELRRAQTEELKTSLKSEKILRGLNSNWTRRMSDAQKEMDEEKAEWNKDYEEKRKSWEDEKNGLEERLSVLECEKEELQLQLLNQSNFTFVADLFCDLLKERVRSKLSQTRNRLFQGHTNTSFAQNETQSFVFSSPNLTWRRLRYGKKAPNRMLTVGGATDQQRSSRALRLFRWVRAITSNNGVRNSVDNQNDAKDEEDDDSPPSSTISPPPGLEPLAPLLVTKKRRRPKLYSNSEKKSTWKSPSLVPKFLR